MSVKIPIDFYSINQGLDSCETFIKNCLNINIDGWAKFRWTIHIGNAANVLKNKNNEKISKQIKLCYIELAKSHYEVVTSLGCLKLSLNQLKGKHDVQLSFVKSIKEFYYHAGRMLDNFARLIYIINDKNASIEINPRKKSCLMRYWIDWVGLINYNGYKIFKNNKQLKEIINIRNILTHSWSFPAYDNGEQLCWPKAIRNRRDLYWPYDEIGNMNRYYKKWLPIVTNIEDDYKFLEKIQNQIFYRLIKDVKKFENNNNIIIT